MLLQFHPQDMYVLFTYSILRRIGFIRINGIRRITWYGNYTAFAPGSAANLSRYAILTEDGPPSASISFRIMAA